MDTSKKDNCSEHGAPNSTAHGNKVADNTSLAHYPHPLTLPWDLRNTFFKLHGVLLHCMETNRPIPCDLITEFERFEECLQTLVANGNKL